MSTQLGVNSNYFSTKLNQNTSPGKILARVDKVILGPTEANGQPDKDFEANGRWASIGCIRFTVMYSGEIVDNVTNTIARPYSPNTTHYPLKGEIVELTFGPSTRLNDGGGEKDLYYKSPVNLWNSVHHNAFPNFLSLANFNSNLAVPYADASKGITATTVTSSQVYPLGATFVEKSTIKNLQPFEGDIIHQSRWGQSIRFGSTVTNSATKNPWSSAGNNGDPIIIIRNGQAVDKSADPWITNIEDINNDAASIYMCSGQAIIIQDLNKFKLDSFTIDSKLTENTTRALKKQPVSTDATSPASQSKFELQYAQTSTQVTVPSTIPQTTVTVTAPYDPFSVGKTLSNNASTTRSPLAPAVRVANTPTGSPIQITTAQGFVGPLPQQSTPIQITTAQGFVGPIPYESTALVVDIKTTTVLPTGQISSSVITAPYDPFGIGKLGAATLNALIKPPLAPTIAAIPTGSKPVAAGGKQTETGEDLEEITAEESQFRFTFDLDLTEAVEYGDGSEENITLPNQGELPDNTGTPPPPPNKIPNNTGGAGTGPRAVEPDVSGISDSRVEIIPGNWKTNDGSILNNLSHVDSRPVCVPMAKAVLAMKDACFAETKRRLLITSGFRPPYESISATTKSGVTISATGQLQLCGPKGNSGCAKPGSSRHGNGIAIDTNTGTSNPIKTYSSPWDPVIGEWMFKNSWRFGFVRGVKNEEWHFEYRPGNTVFSIVPKDHPSWHGIDKDIPG